MAKKPAKKVIVGNLSEDKVVEKSLPLAFMASVPFLLGELKVLDTYLSRINARDPEANTVRFLKEEYEELMGIERMRPERLNKYVKSMMSKVVTIRDPFKQGKITNYTLFEESVLDKDEKNQYYVDLTCTRTAKKLFFNIEKIHYIQYRLKNILPLNSKHSVFLYVYLLNNRYRRTWVVDLKELRERWLYCDSTFYANNYKEFRRDILDKALKEVNEKTDLNFKYTAVKTGRNVTAIKFTLVRDNTALPEAEVLRAESDRYFDKIEDDIEEQIDFIDVLEHPERSIVEDNAAEIEKFEDFRRANSIFMDIPTQNPSKEEAMEKYREALSGFSDAEIEYLLTFANKVISPEGNLPRYLRIQEYFDQKYKYTLANADSPEGTAGFKRYLTAVVEKDAEKQEKKNKKKQKQ